MTSMTVEHGIGQLDNAILRILALWALVSPRDKPSWDIPIVGAWLCHTTCICRPCRTERCASATSYDVDIPSRVIL